jgi:hypothetical protein
MSGESHASAELLTQYAVGRELAPDVLWALEAHLETCARCRELLGGALRGTAVPDRVQGEDVLQRVHRALDADVARSPQSPPQRRWRSPITSRWAPPSLFPWLAMTVAVVAIAVALEVVAADAATQIPSFLLLLAPVAPLLGVAAAWNQRRDPAYEMVAATPRAGIELVLRRTLAVLFVVMPVLALGGLAVGATPVRWLLPCLAFTLGTLALGTVIGVTRAAAGLATLWVGAVVAPSLATSRVSVALAPEAVPAWAGLIVVVIVLLGLQRRALTRLPSGR